MATFAAASVRTDPGQRRTNNEDAVLELPGLVAIADGMGGHAAGELASRLTVEHIAACAGRIRAATRSREGVRQVFEEVLQEASDLVELRADGRQMGTTVVCAVLSDNGTTAWVAHVGDSRAYLRRSGELLKLTKDHNIYESLLERGLSPDEAGRHRGKDKLLQAIGFGFVQPDVAEVHLGTGDTLLLCSDGLTDAVPEAMIGELMHGDIAECSLALIQSANMHGGPDNISVALVRAHEDEDTAILQLGVTHLQQLFLFNGLDDAELRNVAPFLEQRGYADGAVICEEGVPADECIILVRGSADVRRGEVPLTTVGPGDHVGELALIKPWRRTATVTASEAVSALVLTAESYNLLCRTRPRIGVKIGQAMANYVADRLAALTNRLERVQQAVSGRFDGF